MLEQILDKAVRLDASDVHLTVGQPPFFRINGDLRPINVATMKERTIESFLDVLLTPRLREELEKNLAVDFSYVDEKISRRFRVNVYYQRNFPALRVIDVKNVTNRVLFATADEKIFSDLKPRAEALNDEKLSDLMVFVAENWSKPALGKKILTDDRAPVEMLGMQALDKLISQNLQIYKEIYRRDGIDGILNSF